MDALKRVVYFRPVIKSYHNIAYLSISVAFSLLVFSFFMSLDGGKTLLFPVFVLFLSEVLFFSTLFLVCSYSCGSLNTEYIWLYLVNYTSTRFFCFLIH